MILRLIVLLVLCCSGLAGISLADSPSAAPPLQLQSPPSATVKPSQAGNLNLELRDIAPPVALANPTPWPLIIAGAFVLLALAAAIWWLRRQKKPAIIPSVDPWTIALQELNAASTLLESQQPRQYIARLSEILRRYLEERFRLASTRQTTREFLHSLQASTSPELQPARSQLQDFLEQADLAKFAHNIPPSARLAQLTDIVRQLITTTIPPARSA